MEIYLLGVQETKSKFIKGWLTCLGAALVLFMVSGCRVEYHDHHDHQEINVTHIVSYREVDGDISFAAPATYIVSSARATGSVLAGIDPGFGDEYRGFLDFPLRGDNGVPVRADIESACLEIFISHVDEAYAGSGVSLLIDLVSFQPPTLIAGDFDRSVLPPIVTLPVDISTWDQGIIIAIDVTSLMIEAQRLDLPDLQLRFLLDSFAASGLVEIKDDDFATAPQLSVHYF